MSLCTNINREVKKTQGEAVEWKPLQDFARAIDFGRSNNGDNLMAREKLVTSSGREFIQLT